MDQGGRAGQRPPPLRLYLLGGFRVERDGRSLPEAAWERRSAKALVKLLATTPAHRLHRDQVLDLLWPDRAVESADNAFRKALHLARHALEPGLPARGASSYLRMQDDVLGLVPDLVWIDADEFEVLAESGLAQDASDTLEGALAAYRGELLPEERYEDWTATRRTTLADLHLSVLLALAAIAERRGDQTEAAERLRQAAEIEPTREDVQRRLMLIHAFGGQRHRALRQYQACRAAIQRELETDPAPETVALYQAILSGRIGAGSRPVQSSSVPARPPLPAAVRRIARGPLVGREHVCHQVVALLRQAAEGRGGAALVGGEAGVGKTRLVAEAARTAQERDVLVLWGACVEPEGLLPYGPIVEALDAGLAALPLTERTRLASASPELAGLIPTLPNPPDRAASAQQHDLDRMRLYAAVVRLLDELAGQRPLLLVLDDLHLADVATLHLFHHLVRLSGTRRWLLLATYREEEVATGGVLHRLRESGERDGSVRRVALARLPREGCDLLVAALLPGGVIPAEVLDGLFDRSRGNPLFVSELLRALREQGNLVQDGDRWVISGDVRAEVPRQIRDLIGARVDRLGDAVRRVLALAAVAGESCTFRLLRDAGEFDESSLLDAIDRALEAQLLDETGTGYAFRHPLVRLTLSERLSPPRRARLHAALAGAIEGLAEQATDERGELVEALAHHWAAAGEPGRALPYLVRAADRAARVYANADAVALLHRALNLLAEMAAGLPDAPARRAAILERLADLHALAGESGPARDTYLSAADEVGADPLTAARVLRKAASQTLVAGELARAEAILARAELRLDAAPSADGEFERARSLIVKAQVHFLARRFAEALEAAEAGLTLAEAAGSPPDVALACTTAAMACLPLGEWQRGLAFERRAAALADPVQAIREAADIHICLGEYHLYGEEPAEAARSFLRTLDESRRAGAPRSLALCHYYLGMMAYMRGRFAEAVARQSEAIDLYRQVGSASGEAIALLVRGVAGTALGQHEAARTDLERGIELAARGTLGAHGQIRLYAGLGRHHLERNEPQEARWAAELGLGLAEEPSDCICYASIYPVATAAFALTGDLTRARELGERAAAQAQAIGSPYFRCMAAEAQVVVEALSGAWDAAFVAVAEAERLAAAHDFPYERARALLLRAFVHQQRATLPDLTEASALAARAMAMLHALDVPVGAA